MSYHEYFPTEFIDLQEELTYTAHQKLQEILAHNKEEDWLIKLAQICAYCEVVLDDWYTNEDLLKIAKICKRKLVEKREGVVIDLVTTNDDIDEVRGIITNNNDSFLLDMDISKAKNSIH